MVGPAVLTFVKELGEFYGSGDRPQIFGFIDSLEAVDIDSPGLEFLDGTHFWEGHPRYKQPDASDARDLLPRRRRRRRQRRLGRRPEGRLDLRPHVRLLGDPLRHQGRRWRPPATRAPTTARPRRGDRGDDRDSPAGREHPQGDKVFNGKTHQVFGHQHISKVEGGKLDVVHTTSIEDGLYPDEVDYTTQAF